MCELPPSIYLGTVELGTVQYCISGKFRGFTYVNSREFPILGFFANLGIREFSFFFRSAIIIIIFARFLNSRICPREIRKNSNLANITRSTVYLVLPYKSIVDIFGVDNNK